MFENLGIQTVVSTGNLVTWTLIIGVAVTWWIRGMADRRRARNEGDGSLRTDLLSRIAKLDAKIEAQDALIVKEREDCHKSINRLEGQLQLFRHARNNADARFQALLMLLKRNPDDVPGVIRLIEEMAAQQDRTIAAEKGAMMGATLWSDDPVEAAAEQAVQATKDTLGEVRAHRAEENGQ